ncbi:MAG: DUF362 domain-containing protein [Candidatus Cloacimonetes bacterium]|nr:DUF362 domain-containing protein [Candidatus Cloacimonadota bacterium]MCF7814326.1 DUF362 domain-containing protein [Candidatus Cloacimonadota bacterium]MCF7868982.1 DUF362 domain-containing protein [Candidatus Cloacimonadota bacterium]MCF7884376.1 DUF362 domain-containing protein [Candidatus Cloacimonadota bacterium]
MRLFSWKAIILLILMFCLFLSAQNSKQTEPAKVYFTKDISAAGVENIFQYINENVNGKVAIKVHFGEDGNKTFLNPEMVKGLAKQLDATLVETNVLYVGKRRYTESHIKLAKKHGFDFAPIDILDSEGEKVIPVNTSHYQQIKVGSHMDNYGSFLIYSHFKGHGMAGFGGAIKNVAMGLAAISGKMAMHASSIPTYSPSKCISCNLCVPECPGNAITIDPLVIDADKCIGCGTCIGICPQRCFGVPWSSTDRSVFMERLCEYAKGITDNYNMVYINVLANITPACDCAGWPQKPFMDDIGIVASNDIVAVEQASHDLVDKAHNCDNTFLKEVKVNGKRQIEYSAELGMGNRNYELIDIDK